MYQSADSLAAIGAFLLVNYIDFSTNEQITQNYLVITYGRIESIDSISFPIFHTKRYRYFMGLTASWFMPSEYAVN